jgi:glycosyltransferase involved in cell wall biosynthesis
MDDLSGEVVACGPDPDQRVRRVLYEQLVLPRLARACGVEAVFFPHTIAPRWSTPRHVVTVHDLMALSKRTDFSPHKLAYLRWTYRQLARRVRRFVAVSEFTRRELRDKLRIPVERVSIAPNALDDDFMRDAVLDAYDGPPLPDRFLLSVGGTFPHKRLHMVVDAFRHIATANPGLHLVMCGTFTGTPEGRARLEAHAVASGLGDRILLLPRLSRSVFPHLYSRAQCLVSASEFEGFGIPLIEAMAMGCPIAATPAEGVLETLRGHGRVAADFTLDSLVAAIRMQMAARDRASKDLALARDYARSQFTWDASAAAVEAALRGAMDLASEGGDPVVQTEAAALVAD